MVLALPLSALAELPWQFDQHSRYMALGDSLVAGYGAVPATQGYVYLLYQSEVFDRVPNTLLCNAGVPGATSSDVLTYQVPQAVTIFHPTVITITVGGNDVLSILTGADPATVFAEFQKNLGQILFTLRTSLPDTKIYVSNLYSVSEIPGADQAVAAINYIIGQAALAFDVPVADVSSAFKGKEGYLLITRRGAGVYEVHPTNAGYRAMAKAFEEVILKK
jgi:lysophospholipase L1-like esterase